MSNVNANYQLLQEDEVASDQPSVPYYPNPYITQPVNVPFINGVNMANQSIDQSDLENHNRMWHFDVLRYSWLGFNLH